MPFFEGILFDAFMRANSVMFLIYSFFLLGADSMSARLIGIRGSIWNAPLRSSFPFHLQNIAIENFIVKTWV